MLYSAVRHGLKPRPRLPPPASSPPPAPAPASPSTTTHRTSHTHASPATHASLLLRLRSSPALAEARRLHATLLTGGHRHGTILLAQLVHVYVRLGETCHALRVLDGMPRRNSFAWNAAIRGLVDAGRFPDALEAYRAMLDDRSVTADGFTYPPVIKACAALGAVEQGRLIRERVEAGVARGDAEPNVFVQCALVDMFAKCGCLGEARSVFDTMPIKDLAAWTAMIGGAVHTGEWLDAMNLFNRMRSEGFCADSVIVATVIPACGRAKEVHTGTALHGCAVRCGVADVTCVCNALVDMYCKCGCLETADYLFRSIRFKDVVSWSTLIAGYSQNRMYHLSVSLFTEMVSAAGLKPNSNTMASILPSLSELKLLGHGKEIHGFSLRHGLDQSKFLGSAFIDFYSRQGFVRKAETVFELMPKTDVVIWNSMVAGYAVNRDTDSAHCAFRALQKAGFKPDHVTVVSVLPLCNHHSRLTQGKELHGYVVRHCMSSVCSVSNALIDMYCKCCCLEKGKEIFQSMIERDTATYNTLISSLGKHGHEDEAIMLFDQMRRDGIAPDKVTFVALLSSCSHAGLIDKGLYFYDSMLQDYNISPDKEHYSCVVDLYSRSGKLDDAWKFISSLQEGAEIDVLGCLLGACRVHNRTDIAELVSKRIFEQNPSDPGYHILLSNIYADAGMWSDVTRIRTMIEERSLKNKTGNTLI
ncbi:pentatricopeptide repeat-containing protein At4g33990-like [Lolium perenne]|uniref:pentatricopeptide repeat-containing protein At4g33990-like n=1 Tax=Lolium perenne TaxID=4522 RepID=UPI0021EAE5C9|nr:pentatricopeptide repeat-containing protein At4g33990-like [Lolium perenne]XP_051214186.1 pentatricopeptide repeat-containing protein At4g33990-like [Lolium perenne]XP_051214187.1 pentatricopeptide repeat-containing protein At4g33990-like [Lolium perenne]XP_051214188.1 pentatricopeptide repeat-containing protein At4g33990-like [Lolium perenne]XP_051214189.1 pentatricopeptide repeat-containing protein At4g33990-like [Lolium perenne]XP_051214191.1 pentatricopeptide repeat-containing protein A